MIIASTKHLKAVLERWQKLWKDGRSYLVFDTETEPRPPFEEDSNNALIPERAGVRLFALCYQAESYSLPTNLFDSKYPLEFEYGELLEPVFQDAKIIKVMHNANFDYRIANHALSICKIRNVWCTLIGSFVSSEFYSKGLKERAVLLGRFLQETSSVNFAALEEFSYYAEQDVVATEELFLLQRYGEVRRPKKLVNINFKGALVLNPNPFYRLPFRVEDQIFNRFQRRWFDYLETPVLHATLRAERRGFPFDVKHFVRIRKVVAGAREVILKALYRRAGETFNVNSSQQLSKVCDNLGLENPHRTEKGAVSFDVGAITRLIENDPFFRQIAEYRKLEKLQTTYVGTDFTSKVVDTKPNPNTGLEYFVNPKTGRIHGTMNTVQAVTGRNTAENPNLQNIPNKQDTYGIRSCFVGTVRTWRKLHPRYLEKRSLIVLDFGQLELRIMALYCEDPAMIKILTDPKGDIHAYSAEEFGVPRQSAKSLNFLLLYGGGSYMLSEALTTAGIPTEVSMADAYIKKHESVYFRIREFRLELLEEHRTKGKVKLLTGRTRHLPGIMWDDKWSVHTAETVLSNNSVQGAGQDFLKAFIVRSDPFCFNPDKRLSKFEDFPKKHRAYLRDKAVLLEKKRRILKTAHVEFLLQIHDEAVFTVEPSAAEDCLGILADIMTWRHYFPLTKSYTVPLVAEGGVGPDWKTAKSDEAQFKAKAGFEDWRKYQ